MISLWLQYTKLYVDIPLDHLQTNIARMLRPYGARNRGGTGFLQIFNP